MTLFAVELRFFCHFTRFFFRAWNGQDVSYSNGSHLPIVMFQLVCWNVHLRKLTCGRPRTAAALTWRPFCLHLIVPIGSAFRKCSLVPFRISSCFYQNTKPIRGSEQKVVKHLAASCRPYCAAWPIQTVIQQFDEIFIHCFKQNVSLFDLYGPFDIESQISFILGRYATIFVKREMFRPKTEKNGFFPEGSTSVISVPADAMTARSFDLR